MYTRILLFLLCWYDNFAPKLFIVTKVRQFTGYNFWLDLQEKDYFFNQNIYIYTKSVKKKLGNLHILFLITLLIFIVTMDIFFRLNPPKWACCAVLPRCRTGRRCLPFCPQSSRLPFQLRPFDTFLNRLPERKVRRLPCVDYDGIIAESQDSPVHPVTFDGHSYPILSLV